MNDRKPLIAGNWKMNLSIDDSRELIRGIIAGLTDLEGVEALVAPPFTSLVAVRQAIGNSGILLAAQNMHWETNGAYTGEVSGAMLKEAGCTHVILGHSERRSLFNETSETIDLKIKAAVLFDLVPIVCIGETLEQRETGRTFDVLKEQLDISLQNFRADQIMPPSTILAYEPVWAIGTGKTATPDQAQEVHRFVRKWIEETFEPATANRIRILYGGSVKPDNVKDLMSEPDIDGALVGGASLKADSFVRLLHFKAL